MAKQPHHISAHKLLIERDVYERLKFADALNPAQLRSAFEQVGIKINSPQDLQTLANLHYSGQDVSGFKGENGKFYAFDVKEILDQIPVNKTVLAQANVQWTDMIRRGEKLHIIHDEE